MIDNVNGVLDSLGTPEGGAELFDSVADAQTVASTRQAGLDDLLGVFRPGGGSGSDPFDKIKDLVGGGKKPEGGQGGGFFDPIKDTFGKLSDGLSNLINGGKNQTPAATPGTTTPTETSADSASPTQPDATQPAPQPSAPQPAAPQPDTSQTAPEPAAPQPAPSSPLPSQPVGPQPAAPQPDASQSVAPQPAAPQPAPSSPLPSQPVPVTPSGSGASTGNVSTAPDVLKNDFRWVDVQNPFEGWRTYEENPVATDPFNGWAEARKPDSANGSDVQPTNPMKAALQEAFVTQIKSQTAAQSGATGGAADDTSVVGSPKDLLAYEKQLDYELGKAKLDADQKVNMHELKLEADEEIAELNSDHARFEYMENIKNSYLEPDPIDEYEANNDLTYEKAKSDAELEEKLAKLAANKDEELTSIPGENAAKIADGLDEKPAAPADASAGAADAPAEDAALTVPSESA